MDISNVWEATLGQLQLEINKSVFDTWVRGAVLISQDDHAFVVGVPHAYAKDWLENRLAGTIARILGNVVGRSRVEVRFVVSQSGQGDDVAPSIVEATTEQAAAALPLLNGKYLFDGFIVGPSNQLAHAAARAVADKPGETYNPLFLYGGVGLGKTHLLFAIGNVFAVNGLRVVCVSAEQFMHEIIDAIRLRETAAFRAKFRTVDALLIDDAHILGGKETTQDEFFHTFNALHGDGKQIVLTADCAPRAIGVEDRLRSRFEWGLAVDVQPPDFETRLAILRAKASTRRQPIPPDVLAAIARNAPLNVRELEGALNRVCAFADLTGRPLGVAMALSVLGGGAQTGPLTADAILAATAAFFNVELPLLLSDRRTRNVAQARHIAIYLLRENTALSLPAIGAVMGHQHHTTALRSWEKVTAALLHDDTLRQQIATLQTRLRAG